MIKGYRQPAELVVRRGDRQRAPESLAVRDALGHQGSMFRERGDGREAPAYVQGRNQRGDEQAHEEKEESDSSKAVEHSIGPKRGNGDSQNEELGSLLKRYQRYAHGLAGGEHRKTECCLRDGSADPLQVYGSF